MPKYMQGLAGVSEVPLETEIFPMEILQKTQTQMFEEILQTCVFVYALKESAVKKHGSDSAKTYIGGKKEARTYKKSKK